MKGECRISVVALVQGSRANSASAIKSFRLESWVGSDWVPMAEIDNPSMTTVVVIKPAKVSTVRISLKRQPGNSFSIADI